MDVKDERLGDVLNRIFAPFNISYEVIGKQIILQKGDNKIIAFEDTPKEKNSGKFRVPSVLQKTTARWPASVFQ